MIKQILIETKQVQPAKYIHLFTCAYYITTPFATLNRDQPSKAQLSNLLHTSSQECTTHNHRTCYIQPLEQV